MGKLNKTISKLSAALSPVYIHTRQILMVAIYATSGVPSNGKNERRRRRRFQLCWRQLSSRQASGSTRAQFLLFCTRRLARKTIPRHKFASEKETQKETLNVLLHEMTRIRNVRRKSKHFLTIEVDILTNNVVLHMKRTITVFRNPTNNFRTESERLAYDSRPYMRCVNQYKGFDFTGRQSFNFSHRKLTSPL